MATVVETAHAFAAAKAAGREPFKVRDLSLAEFGRKEIRLAEQEMPGLMALRAEYKGKSPLKGAKIMGSLHMTVQLLAIHRYHLSCRQRFNRLYPFNKAFLKFLWLDLRKYTPKSIVRRNTFR